jgi:hypothetical protein
MGIGSAIKKAQKTVTTGGLNLLGGDEPRDTSGEAAAAEEERKRKLRERIDRLYGIGVSTPASEGRPRIEVAGEVYDPGSPAAPGVDASADQEAAAARAALEAEKNQLVEATRAYYADQLSRAYADAERNARFNLARRGVLGGSSEVDIMGDLSSDRSLGATRVDEAVRRAAADLETAREQERLSAIGLVNSGAGDSAVTAAQRGLQNAFASRSSAQKADLTGDLFGAGANAIAAQNMSEAEAALAARYRDRLSTFFQPRSTSGRVTPSA